MDERNPRNLQDLLKFALKYENHEQRESVSIDEDKKKFLESVLQSMSVNVIEEFLNAIRILQNDLSSDEEKCDALDLIKDYIDNIDFANTFVKIEGADILINCVRHANKSVSVSAIGVVAEMSQNNPFCQQYFLKYDIVKLLIEYLNKDDPEVVANALYALSALIRNYEPALMEFKKNDGLKYVVNCLDAQTSRVFLKACFLITSISSECSLVKDDWAKLGVFSKLTKKLRIIDDFEVDVEIALRSMSVLLESPYCKPNEIDKEYIVNILKNIIILNQNLPQCEEIVSYSNSILYKLEAGEELDHNRKC